jgi:hypothetical protein
MGLGNIMMTYKFSPIHNTGRYAIIVINVVASVILNDYSSFNQNLVYHDL